MARLRALRFHFMDSEIVDEVCPYCGGAQLEPQDRSHYWCPACGSSFSRTSIDKQTNDDDLDDDDLDDDFDDE